MVQYNLLLDVINNKLPFFRKEEGKNIIILITKYSFINTFEITVVSKKNPNHVKDVYRDLGAFDTFDMIRELISPLNDK